MILTSRKCGCPYDEKSSKVSVLHMNPHNLHNSSSQLIDESESESEESEDDSCTCKEDGSVEPLSPHKPPIVSKIVSKGMPYKEIEAVFNNNRMVVRIQKEKPPPEYDPPCDCVEIPGAKDSQTNNSQLRSRNSIVFQKSEGCRTINVYPHPDPKPDGPSRYDDRAEGRKDAKSKKVVPLPTVNPEENPNIFVLKIKRKCKGKDIKQNLDLEFKTPRPWRKRDYFQQT